MIAPRRSRPRALRVALVVAAVVAAMATTAAASPNHFGHQPRYYVALGDSLSVGYMPDANGVNHETNLGYADQLYFMERFSMPKLHLVKLGCPGESTSTMISGGVCAYSDGSQLAQAEAFLQAHQDQVAFVTIDLGANDIYKCATGGTIDPACVAGAFQAVGTNLPQIVTGLRAAAGTGVPIVGMNYYDPVLASWLQGPAGRQLAQASVAVLDQYDTLIESVYGAFGYPTADVESAFKTTDFTMVWSPKYGTVPTNVLLICRLTWMCAVPPVGPNIHGNPLGYWVMANAFRQEL